MSDLDSSVGSYSHVTVIAIKDDVTTIIVIPEMEDFQMETKYTEPQRVYDSLFTSREERVLKELTFSGRPMRTKDGTLFTQIQRERE